MSGPHAPHLSPPRHTTARAVWFGVLAPPAAWAIQLIGDWALGEVIACAPANRPVGVVYGIQVNALAAILNGILLLTAIAAGVVSASRWRSLREDTPEAPTGATMWLAMAGVMSSALFSVLIATSFVPLLLIGGCP